MKRRMEQLSNAERALLTYFSDFPAGGESFTLEQFFSEYPFTRYLFSKEELQNYFSDLAKTGFLEQHRHGKETSYCCSTSWKKKDLLPLMHVIPYMDQRISTVLKDIPFSAFPELCQTARRDPCLLQFKNDLQVVDRKDWWQTLCTFAITLSEAVSDADKVIELIESFIRLVEIEIRGGKEVLAAIPRERWKKEQYLNMYIDVDHITPWKSLSCNLLFMQGQDFSIDDRNDLYRQAWDDLIHSAATHHIFIPVGEMGRTARENLDSCLGIVLKDENLKAILTARQPADEFRTILKKKIDITLLSPYSGQGSVSETMFFGRRAEIELIVAHPENNYAVYGGRQSGKTSLLKQLKRMWQKDKNPIYLNCEAGIYDEDDFCTALCLELGLPDAENLEELIKAMKEVPAETVLLLDEMDGILKKCNPNRILGALRKFQEEHNIQCILAGSPVLFKLSKDLTGPLYNFCEPLPLGHLTEQEAVKLAHYPMINLGVNFEKGLSTAKQLVNLAGRFPVLVQLLCQEIVKELSEQKKHLITKEVLDRVFASSGYTQRILDLFFSNLNPKQRLIVCCALLVKEMNLRSIVELVQSKYERLTLDEIQQELNSLEVLFLLTKTGSGYRWQYDNLPTILKKNIDPQWYISQMIRQIEQEKS